MKKQFIIIIGRSGCGKRTHATLLKDHLTKEGLGDVLHISTGQGFRDFGGHKNYVAKMSCLTNTSGMIQPEFLAVWNWSNSFINKLGENDSVILDGAPRKLFEINILHSAVALFGFQRPKVVYVDISEKSAIERLREKKRAGGVNEEDILRRMDWFNSEIMPVISYYEKDPRYDFIRVNGELGIEEVNKDIISKLTF